MEKANKSNFISRSKVAWESKTRKFKIVYIMLFIVCIVFLAMTIWSIAEVDAVRIHAYNEFKPLIQADNTLNHPVWGEVYNKKFMDKGLHAFSWFVASKPEYNALSSNLYILCPISAIITAPLLIYLIASFLVTAFPFKKRQKNKKIEGDKE